jgi:hypothetical protein
MSDTTENVTLTRAEYEAPVEPAALLGVSGEAGCSAALERAITVDRAYRQEGCRSVSSPCGSACRNTVCAS